MEEQNALARRALEMRKAGRSFYQIAEALQLPEVKVAGMVHEAIRNASQLISIATRQELLSMEVSRLDDLQYAVWADAVNGDTRAIETSLKIIAMRAKLLGLDEKVETGPVQAVIISGTTSEYAEALRAISEGNIR